MRSTCMKKSRSRGEIFLYFSALPQYLRRKRPGYAIPLRHITPSNLHVLYKRKWGRFCASKKEIGTHFGATKARESSSSCKISTRDDEAVVLAPVPSRLALGAVFDESTAHQHTEKRKSRTFVLLSVLVSHSGAKSNH